MLRLGIALSILALTSAGPAQEAADPVFAQWRDKVDPAVFELPAAIKALIK